MMHRTQIVAAVFVAGVLAGGCRRRPVEAPASASSEPVASSSPSPPAMASSPSPATGAVSRIDAAPAATTPGAVTRHALVDGIVVDAELTPLASSGRPAGALREGDDVAVRFTVRYSSTGAPIRGARPAAWMHPRAQAAEPSDALSREACAKRIGGFLSESLLDAPAVDLNAWHVVVMNDDASLSIVDPRFGFGGSRLLAMVRLPAPAEDWSLSGDGRRLYVSMPDAGRVAVVETATWKIVGSVDTGARPGRLVRRSQSPAQPASDDGQLWVAVDGALAAIDTGTLQAGARVPLGANPDDVAVLDARPALAFVAERGEHRVAVVDLARRERVADTEVGIAPVAIAVSPASQLAYAVGGDTIVVIDRTGHVAARIITDDGLASVRFASDGRYGLVANPARNRVYVLDASTNRIVKTAEIPGAPERIAFSDTQAYVRSRDSEALHLISLASLGSDGTSLSVGDVPAGQAALGAAPALADAIVPVPGENAMLVANPADHAIYFYKEGMAAPMGTFATYSRRPRAVLVVDRSLQERAPGAYETIGRLGPAGRYDLAFYLDAPRLSQCFELAVAARDPAAVAARAARARIEGIVPPGAGVLRAGVPLTLQFRLTDGGTQAPRPRDGVTDVRVLAMLLPGVWQQRRTAVGAGNGLYQIALTPPQAGVYQFFVEAPSLGMALDHRPELTLRVVEDSHVH